MRGEYYIAQVIQWNDRLRAMICDWVGIPPSDPHRVLSEFFGEENLTAMADNLGCAPEEVFLRLRNNLGRRLYARAERVLPTLGPTDFSLFFEAGFVGEIVKALGCSDNWTDIAAALWDSAALRKLLECTGLAQSGEQKPLGTLMGRLVSADGIQRVSEYYGGPVDIWVVLAGLVNETARGNLCQYLKCQPADMFPTLAAKAEPAVLRLDSSQPEDDGTQRLDMLGVAKLKEMLRVTGEAYIRQACDVAKGLKEREVAARSARMLFALLHYANHSYRMALKEAVIPNRTIGSLGFRLERLSMQVYEDDVDLRAHVIDRNGEAAILVEFRVTREGHWQRLLCLWGLERTFAEHAAKHMTRTTRSLNGFGETLVERLLTSTIPAPPTPEREALQVMTENDDSLVRYFVLSGRKLHDEHDLASALGEAQSQLPEVDMNCRTICPTPQQILERVRTEYLQNVNPPTET